MESKIFRILKLIEKNRSGTRTGDEKFILLNLRIRWIDRHIKIKKLYSIFKNLKKWKKDRNSFI